MRTLILFSLPVLLVAQAPQIVDTVQLKDTRTAVNNALNIVDALKPDKSILTTIGDLPYRGSSTWQRIPASVGWLKWTGSAFTYSAPAKSDVGLANADNTSDANKPVSTAQQTALDGKVPVTRQVNGHALSGDVTVTKADVGLGNADNTSDANKPVSTAQQAALNAKDAITPVSSLPTAASASVGRIYRWTGAASENACPAGGASGSGGSAVAFCVTHDGATWRAVLAMDASGGVAIGGTNLRGGGASLPATCVVGDQYFLTSGSSGLYQCTAADTWTRPDGSGTVSGLTPNCIPLATAGSVLNLDSPFCVNGNGQVVASKAWVLASVPLTSATTVNVDLALGNRFRITLGHNVTTLNFSHPVAGYHGWLVITQGNPTIYTWAGFSGSCQVPQGAGKTLWQEFEVDDDGTTMRSINCTSNETPTFIEGPERPAVTATLAGRGALTYDDTSHTAVYFANNSSARHIAPRCAGSTDQCASGDLSDAAAIKARSTTWTLHGGGSALTSGMQSWEIFPVASTITGYDLVCNESGSIVLDLWKTAYAAAPAASSAGTTITASAKPTLSSGQRATSSTLTGWTTSISAGDYIRVNIDSTSTVTLCTFSLKYSIN